MKRKKPRYIVVVSDLHVGSEIALCPAKFDLGDGHKHAVREWLREQWTVFQKRVDAITEGDDFVLVLNADMVEGIHHGGHELALKSVVGQFRAACMILKPLVERAACAYMTEGTHCHTLDNEHDIAEDLKLVKAPMGWAWPRLKLKIHGKVHSFRHHIGTTSRPWLEANALGMSQASERLNALNAGEEPTDVLVAAHRHVGGYTRTQSGLTVVTPSWQFPTRHVYRVVPEARPVVGGCVLDYARAMPGDLPVPHLIELRPEPDKGINHD